MIIYVWCILALWFFLPKHHYSIFDENGEENKKVDLNLPQKRVKR